MADLPAVRSFINLIDSGVKTCSINLIVYRMLYLCISAPLYEARYSKDSGKCFYLYASEAKHTSVYALLLKRHSCRIWLWRKQSPKNIKASSKSRDMHKYNMLYTFKINQDVLTPES